MSTFSISGCFLPKTSNFENYHLQPIPLQHFDYGHVSEQNPNDCNYPVFLVIINIGECKNKF